MAKTPRPPSSLHGDRSVSRPSLRQGSSECASFFRSLRAKAKGPPTYYFGNSAMFKRAELEEWLPSIFSSGSWSRRPKSGTGAKVKTKVNTKAGEVCAD